MTTIGSYEVLDELGRGGMGVVFRVRHGPTGALRALKLLEGVPDAESLERFRREGAALARMRKGGVVPVHETGVDGRRLYLAMDLMPGGSLRARLRGAGRLPWNEAATLGAKLAKTLSWAHGAGLVHRDLKPDNVLFDDRGEPCLADWGCVRDLAASALTLSGESLGTPDYMAPEQLSGERVGPPADVWALGVLLHEVVSGAKPFGGSLPRIHEAAVSRRRASLVASGAPQALDDLVGRALEPDPAKRPAAAELARALEAVAPAEAAAPRRRDLHVALGAAAAVGALVVSVVLVARRGGQPLAGVSDGARSPAPAPTPSPVARPSPALAPDAAERQRSDLAIVQSLLAGVPTAQVDFTLGTGATAAQKLGVDRLVVPAREAAARLAAESRLEPTAAKDSPLAAAMQTWGELAWSLARLPRSDEGDVTVGDRCEVMRSVLGGLPWRSLWLRGGTLALERDPGNSHSCEWTDAELADLAAEHKVEAAFLYAMARQWNASSVGAGEWERIALADEPRLDDLSRVKGDRVVDTARGFLVLDTFWAEVNWAKSLRGDERRRRFEKVRAVAALFGPGSALSASEDFDAPRVIVDGALLGGVLGPVDPAERQRLAAELGALAAHKRDGMEDAFALVRDFWGTAEGAARRPGLEAIRERARALADRRDAREKVRGWARGIALACSLELGEDAAARQLVEAADGISDGPLAVGWFWVDVADRVAAPPPPGGR
jgi:serine/threonine-protein kinase